MSEPPPAAGPAPDSARLPAPDPHPEVPWQRLDRRMIVVDAVQVLVSLGAGAVLAWSFGGSVAGSWWPVVAVVASGVFAATVDAYRWLVTRYRITNELVERRSGLVVREYRSLRRDRIRSVDIHANLRHRLGGLRLVKIGAGQEAATGEAAFDLDAVSIAEAHTLRSLLLAHETDRPVKVSVDDADQGASDATSPPGTELLSRLRYRWVLHNVFNIWAFVMALGLLWGAYWLGPIVGVSPAEFLDRVVDWDSLGLGWTLPIGIVAVGVVGVVGLTVNFIFEYWDFELTRVPTDDGGTLLRTRHGLLTTREVSRDERRMRGVQIAEPLLWRWMGTTDTTVITTGLSQTSISQPAAILPRVPLATALTVTDTVLQASPNPLRSPLDPHPRAALRRRLVWATLTTLTLVAALGGLAVTDIVPFAVLWVGVALWPIALAAAVVAFRALGHTIINDHLVVRSGLVSRATTALERSAVSTIAVRESLLQRRLGLQTVSVMTAAGDGAYDAPDLDADQAVSFAAQAAPHLLDAFVVQQPGV